MEQLIIIEKGLDGTYDARMEENKNLKIWFYGQGNTVQEAIDDLYEAYKEAKEICEKEGDILPDMNFKYKYDVASFLNYYSKKLIKVSFPTMLPVGKNLVLQQSRR